MFKNDLYLYGEETNEQLPVHLNYGKYILDCLKSNLNNNLAMVNGHTGETLTYRELTEYAVKLSVSLAKLGVLRGDVVGLGYHAPIEHIPITLAILLTGAAFTLFMYNKDPDRTILLHKLNLSKPKYFIVSKSFWDVHSEVLKASEHIKKFIILDGEIEDAIPIKSLLSHDVDITRFEPKDVKGQVDVAAIYFSSGTTGINKAAQYSHYTCLARLSASDILKEESLQTIFVCGVWYTEICTFFAIKFLTLGRKVVFTSDPAPHVVLKCLQDHKVNVTKMTPHLLENICYVQERTQFYVDELKAVISGSCVLHPATIANVQKRFPNLRLYQIYGLTEQGLLTSSMIPNAKHCKVESVGFVIPNSVIKIVDPETQQVLGPNQKGELCSKTPSMMKCYIGQDTSTDMDEEGFYKSGDMAYYDEDGCVFIVGRYKHIIMYRGFKIPYRDLEDILLRHPGVRQVAVVGKPVPVYGEVPTAFVVRHDGCDVSEQQIIDFLAPEVESYMELRGGVRFVTELPKNGLQKVIRSQLVKQLIDEGETTIIHDIHLPIL